MLEEVIATAENTQRENVGILARLQLMTLLKVEGMQEKLNVRMCRGC